MLALRTLYIFRLNQSSYLQVKLYEIWHYYRFKEQNHQWMRRIKYVLRSQYHVCISFGCKSAIPNAYVCLFCAIPSIHLICTMVLPVKSSGIFRVPLSLHSKTHRVSQSQNQSVKNTLPHSHCGQSRCSADQLRQTVLCLEGQHWTTCSDTTLMK